FDFPAKTTSFCSSAALQCCLLPHHLPYLARSPSPSPSPSPTLNPCSVTGTWMQKNKSWAVTWGRCGRRRHPQTPPPNGDPGTGGGREGRRRGDEAASPGAHKRRGGWGWRK
ncbi:unnamed protein product, partial [Discosporangium mesarthrocarpum]